MSKGIKVGGCWGGGGAKGEFHVGVLIEMCEMLGASSDGQLGKFTKFAVTCWDEIHTSHDIYRKRWPLSACNKPSFLDNWPLREYLMSRVTFERAKTGTPVDFASADMLACKLVKHSSREAIDTADLVSMGCASSSFPGGAFPPEKRRDGYFSDGGLFTITPVRFSIDAGCTHVLASSCRNSDRPDLMSEEEFKTPFATALRHLDMMENGISARDIREVQWVNRLVEAGHPSVEGKKIIHLDHLFPDEPLGSGLDFTHEKGLFRRHVGRRCARRYFSEHPESLAFYKDGFHHGVGNSVGAILGLGLTQFLPRSEGV